MTELDPETKARIEAEERYRASLRSGQGGFSLTTALGLLGGVLLVLGAFLPIATVPLYGAVSLFGRGPGDGVIVLALGGVAIILSLIPRARIGLTLVGLVALLVVLLDYRSMMTLMASQEAPLVQSGVGWGVLALGILLTLIAPLLHRPE